MGNLIRNTISALWMLKVIVSALAGLMLLQSSATIIHAKGTDITFLFSLVLFFLSMLFLSVAYSNYKFYFKYTFSTVSILGLLYISLVIQQISLLTAGEFPALKNVYTQGTALFICIVTLIYSYAKNRSNINA